MKKDKLKVRGEKKVNGVTYITLAQVVDDYISGRNNETIDTDFKIEENNSVINNLNTFNAEQKIFL